MTDEETIQQHVKSMKLSRLNTARLRRLHDDLVGALSEPTRDAMLKETTRLLEARRVRAARIGAKA